MTTQEPWRLGHDGQPLDESDCPVCGRDACEDPAHFPPNVEDEHLSTEPVDGVKRGKCAHVLDNQAVCTLCGITFGLDVEGLHDSVDVAARGRKIAEDGIPYLVDGLVPNYGMLGFLVAYAKVGKTSLGHALGAAGSRGDSFLGKATTSTRVLYIAAEDPPQYTEWLARVLNTEPGRMTFYMKNVTLSDSGLARIVTSVRAGGYGFVLIASWQAVLRGLVRDENDNAGAATVVESVKIATRQTGIPWLIDAHSGRGEDQADDAECQH